MIAWRPDYGWIDSFWRDVVAERGDRTWLIATGFDDDLELRYGYALATLQRRLRCREDVAYYYAHAWTAAVEQLRSRRTDVLFVGRPLSFAAGELAPFATPLEAFARGCLVRDRRYGPPGTAISYGSSVFAIQDMPGSRGGGPRKLDYGVLLSRTAVIDEEPRRLVAIAGLGAIGTLGLTLCLVDDERRRQLWREVQEVAGWHAGLRPEESAEICVRITVPGDEQLGFLNAGRFAFSVAAVAIAGGEVVVREQPEVELELEPDRNGGGRGLLRLGGAEVRLSQKRFVLLDQLKRHPDGVDPWELCRHPILLEGRKKSGEPNTATLAKLVHDTNKYLHRHFGAGHSRLIRHDRRAGRYVLAIGRKRRD
jgi:hypothetical protein